MKTEFQISLSKLLFTVLFFSCALAYTQTVVPFSKRYETSGINGDLTIIGNSIISNHAQDPYTGDGNNNDFDMVYTDIDNDASTFSSSSASLSLSSCSKVVYAGLYWGARATLATQEPENIKFKLPGGNYLDITADVIFDDLVFYKDITTEVAALNNPNGNYFAANIPCDVDDDTATTNSGMAAGWALVVVYEDPNEHRKYISTFDGLTEVAPNNLEQFQYSGFVTPPSGAVEGTIGIAALEGDRQLTGEQLLFADELLGGTEPNTSFTTLYDAENPSDNFFNSKVTINGAQVTTKSPNHTNTLGWDIALVDLQPLNPGNSILSNGATEATVRIDTDGDRIFPFLNTFSVNIIEPVLQVLTSVEDESGNQITHQSPVSLGATVWYNIDFRNIGTDNAENTYVINTIPINVTLDESSIELPAGVSYSYNAANRELRFDIPNNLVEKKDLSAVHTIRYQVTASDDCFDYTDACTNLLENNITSYYDGETSGQNVAGNPGLNGINGCGIGNVGSMDLFVDTSSCSFDSELFFCNNNLTFEGDDGYDTYVWTDSSGNVIGNTKEITVTGPGVYTAKQRRTGCTETTRVVTVLGLDVSVDPVNALCKDSNGSVNITVNESSPSYTYELSQNGSVIDTESSTSSNQHTFTNLDIGDYSVRTTNANGCYTVQTFSISEPTLLEATSVKLYNATTCNGAILDGSLEVSATGGTPPYQYSIDGGANYQDSTVFMVGQDKTYDITVKDANGCTTVTSVAMGLDEEIVYDLIVEDVICMGGKDGRIRVDVSNNQGYTVTYSLDAVNYQSSPEFTGLAVGSYDVWVKKENGHNVCETKNTVEINQLIHLGLMAETNFSCDNSGDIIIAQVDPIYQNEVTFFLDGNRQSTDGIFDNVSSGTHTVTVKHNQYGCSDTPIEVNIIDYTPVTFQVINTDVNQYTVEAVGGEPGYEYSFDDDDSFSANNVLTIRSSRDYTFYVKDAKGCIVEQTLFLEFLDIEIPDFFTPEGDGINDTWYPIHIDPYPNITVKIFDRYQRLIASYKGNQYSWNGLYKNKPLPSGDYWYIIKLNESSDNREFKGNFTLVR